MSFATACRYAIYHSCHFLGKRRLDACLDAQLGIQAVKRAMGASGKGAHKAGH